MSQEGSSNPEGLAEADVKDTTVTLPAGVAIHPAGGDGLQACSQAEVVLDRAGAVACPDVSKVGLVRINGATIKQATHSTEAEKTSSWLGVAGMAALSVAVPPAPSSGGRTRLGAFCGGGGAGHDRAPGPHVFDPLPFGFAGLPVLGERIERRAPVCDLDRPVRALDRAERADFAAWPAASGDCEGMPNAGAGRARAYELSILLAA